jgi:hypothetical protein
MHVELFQRISSADIMQKRSPIVPQLRAVTVRWSTILFRNLAYLRSDPYVSLLKNCSVQI